MKVSELTGGDLDFWVARAEGIELDANGVAVSQNGTRIAYQHDSDRVPFSPSTAWVDGGPIIEREHIQLLHNQHRGWYVPMFAEGEIVAGRFTSPSPLITAMRSFVASKFGDEVPDEKE